MFYAKKLSISIDKSHTLYQQEELEILIEEIPCRQAVGS